LKRPSWERFLLAIIMSVPSFLTALFESGRVQVGAPGEGLTTSEMAAAERIVVEQAKVLALEFPGLSPTWSPVAASWAVVSLYRASQLAVYRLLDAGAIDELLAVPCPPGDPASRHWSVDAVFRFLPDLVRHATAASPQDPLVERLRLWCAEWPLSSVGVAGIVPQHEDEIATHHGLLQLYVDRILAKKDRSRLAHPAVRAAIDKSLGGHRTLWMEVVG
jgi:MoxR-vWA-beta-propeller ternary system domain bpX4